MVAETGLEPVRPTPISEEVLAPNRRVVEHAAYRRVSPLSPFRANLGRLSGLSDRLIALTEATGPPTRLTIIAGVRIPPTLR